MIIRETDEEPQVIKMETIPMKKPKGALKFKCSKCEDTKTIEVKGHKVKCSCLVKEELSKWIKPMLKRYAKMITVTPTKSKGYKVLFRNSPIGVVFKEYTKQLLRDYYAKGMILFEYHIISGEDFTESYVKGEHNKYRSCESLVIMLGADNYNKTLSTTILSLILHRDLHQLTTWVVVNDEHRNTGSMIDLYGGELVELVDDRKFWDSIILKTKVIKTTCVEK